MRRSAPTAAVLPASSAAVLYARNGGRPEAAGSRYQALDTRGIVAAA